MIVSLNGFPKSGSRLPVRSCWAPIAALRARWSQSILLLLALSFPLASAAAPAAPAPSKKALQARAPATAKGSKTQPVASQRKPSAVAAAKPAGSKRAVGAAAKPPARAAQPSAQPSAQRSAQPSGQAVGATASATPSRRRLGRAGAAAAVGAAAAAASATTPAASGNAQAGAPPSPAPGAAPEAGAPVSAGASTPASPPIGSSAPTLPIVGSAPASTSASPPPPAPLRAARAQLPSAPGDDWVVQARNAFAANDSVRVAAAAAALESTHPLRPQVEAWRLRLQINEARVDADTPVRAFLERFNGTLAAEGVRRDWLLSLARRGLWTEFEQQYARLPVRAEDPQPACADARRRALVGDPIALTAAREALPMGRELGEFCALLLEQLAGQGALSQGDLWRRLLAAVDGGALGAVRKFAGLLPALDDARALSAALEQPQAEVLVAPNANFRELVVIALARQARSDPVAAAERLRRYGPRLADEDRAWVWAEVAAAGARKLHPEAAEWARQGAIVAGAGVALGTVSDDTLAWIARAGLRSRDWKLVRGAIERMSELGRTDPTWRYWWAKAALAEGRTEEAQLQLRAIAGPWSFYALLAAEEIGLAQSISTRPMTFSDDEMAEVLATGGVVRALKFADLGLRAESVKEMAFTVRSLSDRQILALAEALRRRGLHDRSIAVAERTVNSHDASLRFPTPYRDPLSEAARAQELEPAYVYGLVRQESRFLADARSGVGAAGLMQLMPATAKWVARKVGESGYSPARIQEPELNLRFGSFYLRRVLDELDGSQMLAAAAYNAGPGRPKAWRASLSQSIEGAAFAESIPFTETRDYVKKVLANAVVYAAVLDPATAQRLPSLKARLGQVAPRAAVPGEAP